MFELGVAERILRLVRFRIPTIPAEPHAAILLVQWSRIRCAMAFSARAHGHGYLVLFAHNLILHPRTVSCGNSQHSGGLVVSMLEKSSQEPVRDLDVNSD